MMKYALLRLEADGWLIPTITVHDEIDVYFDARHEPNEVKRRIEEAMALPLPEIPDLTNSYRC